MKAKEVINFIEKIAPPNSGIKEDDNKLLFGNPDSKLKGIGVAWMSTTPVIKDAISKGVNLLIVHERLFFPRQDSEWYTDIHEEKKEVNKRKKELLEKNKIVVYRAHSNWDALKDYGVADSLGSKLGYQKVIGETKFFKTYEIKTKKLGEVASDIKSKLNLEFVKVYGDLNAKISRITPLIGGFGGNQKTMSEIAKGHGSQAIIVGDLVESTTIYAQELGLSIIETVHSSSEKPGLESQFKLLKEKFPKIPIFFFDSGCLFFKKFEPKIV